MDVISKPILYNNYKLHDNLEVRIRIEKTINAEVYLLSNESYLYLYRDINENRVVNKTLVKEIITIHDSLYIGVIDSLYSHGKIEEIYNHLTVLKGLANVAGMHDLKEILINEVIKPLTEPEKYKKFKLAIPNGLLLFGPPGCGKTFIVEKLAEELNRTFIELKHSDVGSSYIYGAVANLGKFFDIAREKAPSIIFIDEISGLAPKRESLVTSTMHKEEEVNELLMQMNQASEQNVLVVGATNYPERIDSAILRPGRMDKIIFVPMPDRQARYELFNMYLNGRPHTSNIVFDELAVLTEGFTATDIKLIVENTARTAVRENKAEITFEMLLHKIRHTEPSITKEEVERYQQFQKLERW